MRIFVLVMAAIHGFAAVGVLALLQATIAATFSPGWALPFSHWWGLLFCLPGIAFAFIDWRACK